MRTALVIVWVCACQAYAASDGPREWRIVVNTGAFESAAKASAAYRAVNWLDADATDETVSTECFAAVELRRYLCRMTGTDEADGDAFAVCDDDTPASGAVILVGNARSNRELARRVASLQYSEDATPRTGAFHILTDPDATPPVVALAGDDRTGTLYAAYAFLEALGVRWLEPGDAHEEVPRAIGLTIPKLNRREAPAFRTRGFWAWEDRGTEDFYLWMARNRMNFWTVACGDPAFLKRLGIELVCGGHQHMWRFLNPKHEYPYRFAGFAGGTDKPADPYPSGEGKGDADGDGTLTYAEAHPEWYGLHNGKRSFRIEHDFGDNYCTSNPHATAEFLKNLVADLAAGEWRWADHIHFWTLDGGNWCTCASCAAVGTPTDRNLLLVHQLRQAILKARAEGRLNRDVAIQFLAYADVIEPPTRPLPDGFDYEHCVATFYPIARCYVHPFASPDCTEFNAAYRKHYHGWFLAPDRRYRGQIFIGEYYNVSGYKNLPLVFSRSMAEDIPYYYETGARHMHYMHAPVANWGPRALTNYQLARMLWDPSLDVQALWDDFFANRYGPAAGIMRAFYDRLESALSNVTVLKYHLARALASGAEDLFPLKHMPYLPTRFERDNGPSFVEIVSEMRACRTLIDRAASLQLADRHRARVQEDRDLFAYGENTVGILDALVRVQEDLRAGREVEARQALVEAEHFAAALRADTRSTRFASSHANAPDGLVASFVEPALRRARQRLVSPADAPAPGTP